MSEMMERNHEGQAKREEMFAMYLLFAGKTVRPPLPEVVDILEHSFGKAELVEDIDGTLAALALPDHLVEYGDGKLPVQLLVGSPEIFDPSMISPAQRLQLWDCEQGEELIENMNYQIMISDFMSYKLPWQERAAILTCFLEDLLFCCPGCQAVFIPSSGKLLRAEDIRNSKAAGFDKFLNFAVNVRFFKEEDTEDCVVDTLGMYALGLSDLQYRFRGIKPWMVVNHAYALLSYLLESGRMLKDGETLAGVSGQGMDENLRWKCHYKESLIQPAREVIDIETGEFPSDV